MSNQTEAKLCEDDDRTVYENYMKQLQQWRDSTKWHAWMWNHYAMMSSIGFHMQMMSAQHPPRHSTEQTEAAETNTNQFRNNEMQINFREYKIPSLSRRVLAELIDFFILLLFKAAALWMVVYLGDFDSSFDVYSDGLFGVKFMKMIADEELRDIENWEDYLAEQLNSDAFAPLEKELPYMILLTCFFRFITTLYEWLFIWCCGSTPGKHMCGLTVVCCKSTAPGLPHTAMVSPGTPVSASSALLRALVKNLMISLLIPAFISAFLSIYRRTSYDYISNTIVVDKRARLNRNR